MKKYAVILAASLALAGCTQREQTRAREETNEAARDTGDALDRAGKKVESGAKEAWKETKEAARETGDALERAGDKVSDKTREAGREVKEESREAAREADRRTR